MLHHLTIRNFVLVRELDVDFHAGLTAITGESGAGKSILLGALGMVLGDRANTDQIRPGAARADIAAEFDISHSPQVQAMLAARELIDDDAPGRCLLRRVLNREGRSRAFVNGAPVTRADLRQLAGNLIDIHAQHDHLRLANREVQLQLLDDFGGHAELRDAVREQYLAWQATDARLTRLREQLGDGGDRADLLTYQVEELNALALGDEELTQLEADHRRLSQVATLQSVTAQALHELTEGNPVPALVTSVDGLQDDHEALSAAKDLLSSAQTHLDEATSELRRYQDGLADDPSALQSIEARLDAIHALARKHRITPETLPAHHLSLKQELAALSGSEEEQQALEASLVAQRNAYESACKALTIARKAAAKPFARAISAHMKTLGINGSLSVKFQPQEGANGAETAEYFVKTNPKYPAGPLTKIASGGERARIDLSIQVVAAEKTKLPSLVLDEADVGVGGTTADTLGRRLRNLAEHIQVLCVTHAPQIAALAEYHLLVNKDDEQNSSITALNRKERVEELARMLGGAEITAKTRSYARNLMENA